MKFLGILFLIFGVFGAAKSLLRKIVNDFSLIFWIAVLLIGLGALGIKL